MISEEFAKAEFARWAEACDFDLDPQYMNSDTREDVARRERIITRAMCAGHLTVDGEGVLRYALQLGPIKGVTEVVFDPNPDGSALLATDTTKPGRDAAKLYAMVQCLTKTPAGFMVAAKRRDREVILAVAGFF